MSMNDPAKTAMAAQIAEVNQKMATEEKKVEDAYKQIGKLYVVLHSADYEAEFKPMFDMIAEAEQAIRTCRDRVREIRGVVCCEKCGTDVPSTNAFCSVCGAALPGKTETVDLSDMVRCTVCGKMVKKGTDFCTSCGMPIKRIAEKQETPAQVATPAVTEQPPVVEKAAPAVEDVTVPPVAETVIVPPVVEVPPVTQEAPATIETPAVEEEPRTVPAPICKACGKQVKPGMKFCTACGQRLEEEAAPAAAAPKICPTCGKEVAPNFRFCVGCGTRV